MFVDPDRLARLVLRQVEEMRPGVVLPLERAVLIEGPHRLHRTSQRVDGRWFLVVPFIVALSL
jgi:hypothetical protein